MDENDLPPKIGMAISQDDIQGGFDTDKALEVTKNGYKYLVLETTPPVYDLVKRLCDGFVVNGIQTYLEFPALWKYNEYDYEFIKTLIESYRIRCVFVRITEGAKINAENVIQKLLGLLPVKIYFNSAFTDPKIPSTNMNSIYKAAIKHLPQENFDFAPILFDTKAELPDGWIPRIFAKDSDYVNKLVERRPYPEMLFYPYKNISDSSVIKQEEPVKEKVNTSTKYKCVVETYMRKAPSVHGVVLDPIEVGTVYDVLEISRENEYNIFGKVGKEAWIILRYKGTYYFSQQE